MRDTLISMSLTLTLWSIKANAVCRVELFPGDYVTISASRYPFANVMPPGRRSEDWVNAISRTLQWNSRQRQKAFNEWDGEKVEEGKSVEKDRKKDNERVFNSGDGVEDEDDEDDGGGAKDQDYFNSN